MNYYSRITAIQENQLRPHLEYLMRCLMWAEDECGGRLDLIQSNGPLNSIRYGTLIARQMQRLENSLLKQIRFILRQVYLILMMFTKLALVVLA